MVFCFLGIGECGSFSENKSLMENQTNALHEFLSKQVSDTITKTSTTMENYQAIELYGKGTIILQDIDMSQYAVLTADMSTKIQANLKDKDTIEQIVDILAKENLKTKSTSAGILGAPTRAFTSSETKFITNVKDQVKKIMETRSQSSCLANVLSKQDIKANSSDGSIIAKGIHIEQKTNAVVHCTILDLKDVFSKVTVDQKLSEDIRKEQSTISSSRGILGIIMDFLMAKLWITIIALSSVVIIPIVVIIVIYFLRRSTARQENFKSKK